MSDGLKKIKVFGEVEMDIKQILINIMSNLHEGDRMRASDSKPENALAGRYYNFATLYCEAGLLLYSDEPVCFKHSRKMHLCDCGCGMYRCWDCIHSDEATLAKAKPVEVR